MPPKPAAPPTKKPAASAAPKGKPSAPASSTKPQQQQQARTAAFAPQAAPAFQKQGGAKRQRIKKDNIFKVAFHDLPNFLKEGKITVDSKATKYDKSSGVYIRIVNRETGDPVRVNVCLGHPHTELIQFPGGTKTQEEEGKEDKYKLPHRMKKTCDPQYDDEATFSDRLYKTAIAHDQWWMQEIFNNPKAFPVDKSNDQLRMAQIEANFYRASFNHKPPGVDDDDWDPDAFDPRIKAKIRPLMPSDDGSFMMGTRCVEVMPITDADRAAGTYRKVPESRAVNDALAIPKYSEGWTNCHFDKIWLNQSTFGIQWECDTVWYIRPKERKQESEFQGVKCVEATEEEYDREVGGGGAAAGAGGEDDGNEYAEGDEGGDGQEDEEGQEEEVEEGPKRTNVKAYNLVPAQTKGKGRPVKVEEPEEEPAEEEEEEDDLTPYADDSPAELKRKAKARAALAALQKQAAATTAKLAKKPVASPPPPPPQQMKKKAAPAPAPVAAKKRPRQEVEEEEAPQPAPPKKKQAVPPKKVKVAKEEEPVAEEPTAAEEDGEEDGEEAPQQDDLEDQDAQALLEAEMHQDAQ